MATTLSITPTRFIASAGKLDSNKRYIRRNDIAPELKFVTGQNMDVSGGGLRYVDPDGDALDDGSYDGSFTASAAVGIET